MSPYSAEDARGLFKAAVRDPDPCLVLECEVCYNYKFELSDKALDKNFIIPIGKAHVEKAGKDCTIVGHGRALHPTMEAVKTLAKEGN